MQTKKLIIIKLCLHNSNYDSHCLIAKKRKETEKISIGDSMNSEVELLEQGRGHTFLAEGNPEPSRKQNQEDWV